jgi:hypothetical protein
VDDASLLTALKLKYVGCLGLSRIIVSQLSIATTSNMVGRSIASSCTHNNAMLITLIISAE